MPAVRRCRRPAISQEVIKLVQAWPRVLGTLMRTGACRRFVKEVTIQSCTELGLTADRLRFTEVDGRLLSIDSKFELELRHHETRERWLTLFRAALGLRVCLKQHEFQVVGCNLDTKRVRLRAGFDGFWYNEPVVLELDRPDATSSNAFRRTNLVVPGDQTLGGLELEYESFSAGACAVVAAPCLSAVLPAPLCQLVRKYMTL